MKNIGMLNLYKGLRFALLPIVGILLLTTSSAYGQLFPSKSMKMSFQRSAKDVNTDKTENVDAYTVTYTPRSNGTTRVSIRGARTGVNPYDYAYEYGISNTATTYEVDMMSIVDPLQTRIEPNVQRTYKGDRIVYPKTLTVGQTLPDAAGVFTLKISMKDREPIVMKHNISLRNRKVERMETVTIEGVTQNAFVVSGQYEFEVLNPQGQSAYKKSDNNFVQWIAVGKGIVKEASQDKNFLTTETVKQ